MYTVLDFHCYTVRYYDGMRKIILINGLMLIFIYCVQQISFCNSLPPTTCINMHIYESKTKFDQKILKRMFFNVDRTTSFVVT